MPARKKAGSTTRKKKTAAKKKVVKRTAASKPAAKKKAVAKKKVTAKKTTKKKAVTKKKVVAKKTATKKKVAAKKAPAKKAPAKKATAKKAVAKKSTRKSALDAPTIQPYEDQRDHFRQILLNWKMELMQEVDRTVGHMKDEAANFPDPNDRATQESEFSLELRTRDRERKLIKKIEEAINSVDSGDYGYCESCGIEIGVRRLEARPTATQCIDCKTLDEIREKQMGG